MLESRFYKPEKTYFNALASTTQMVEYLADRGVKCAERRKMKMWDATRGYSLL
jgi:tRNA-dihydrouridine synthase 4